MEEHRPRKLLDQVYACPELAEGMPSASNTQDLGTAGHRHIVLNGQRKRVRM